MKFHVNVIFFIKIAATTGIYTLAHHVALPICDVWFSVCGGLFPRTAKAIADAAARHDQQQVAALSERFTPLWALFTQHGGGIRVIAAAATLLGLVSPECLPRPLKALGRDDVAEIAAVLRATGLE